MDVRLICGDALASLRRLESGSVHCCATSPPYYALRDYGTGTWRGGDAECDHKPRAASRSTKPANGLTGGKTTVDAGTVLRGHCHCGARRVDRQIGLEESPEAYVARLVEVFREVKRVMREDATLWLNLGDSYGGPKGDTSGSILYSAKHREFGLAKGRAHGTPKNLLGMPWRVAFALQADGWILRSDCIWHKPNPMPESVTDRPTKAHEYLFILAKSGNYYYDATAISEPAVHAGEFRVTSPKSFAGQAKGIGVKPSGNAIEGSVVHIGQTRNRRTVWTIATQSFKGAHFATFPEKLVEPCILAGCPEGGLVLDPFSGSGTTGLVALKNGRKFVGIELNREYVKMAKKRLAPLVKTSLAA